MSNRQPKYLSKKKVKSIKCDYLLLLGERSNGKSYSVKSICVEQAYKNKKLFIYLKRYDLEVKDSLCVSYFADMPIQEITSGEYTCIDVFRKGIYLANIDPESGKVVRGQKIGICHALSGAEHYKSLQYPDVENIIYEEIISQNGQYLFNEPDALQQYVSSIFRNNRKGKIYMIGNTLSRICPYYNYWELDTRSMKPGEIRHFIKKNEDGPDTDIAVFLTESLKTNTGLFFGRAAKNITQGAYATEPQPRLPDDIRNYKILYRVVLQYENIMFMMQVLQHNESNDITWYITPKTTAIDKNTRVVSTEFSTSPYYSRLLIGITQKENELFKMLMDGRVCFSDDLTGTEFYNLLPKFRRVRV